MYCRNCGNEVNEKAVACPSCGFNPKTEKKYCYECGTPTKEKQIVCTNCGVELNHSTNSYPKLGRLFENKSLGLTKMSIILSFVGSFLLIVSMFLPWVKSRASGFGTSLSSSANGFEVGHAYYILLFVLVITILTILKNKYIFIPAILSLLDGITVISGIGSKSLSFGGASASSGFSIGPVLVIIASIIIIIAPFIKTNKSKNNNLKGANWDTFKTTILKITQSEYFKIGLPIFLFLLGLFSGNRYTFPIWSIVLLIYPIYFTYKYYKRLFPLTITLVIIKISTYFSVLLRIYHSSGLSIEITNSLLIAINFTFYIFIITLLIAIIMEIKKGELLPLRFKNKIQKFNIINKNWIYILSSFLIILIPTLIINLSSLVYLSEDDKKEITKPFNEIYGDWVFVDKTETGGFEVFIDSVKLEVINDYGRIIITQELTLYQKDHNLTFMYEYDNSYEDIELYQREYIGKKYYMDNKIIRFLSFTKDSINCNLITYEEDIETAKFRKYTAFRREIYEKLIEKKRQKEEEEYLKTYNDIEESSSDTTETEPMNIAEQTDSTIWYRINDPDGYSNLRDAPNGDIIRKVLQDEYFEVVSTENKYCKVRFKDGTEGYIHESRVVESNN